MTNTDADKFLLTGQDAVDAFGYALDNLEEAGLSVAALRDAECLRCVDVPNVGNILVVVRLANGDAVATWAHGAPTILTDDDLQQLKGAAFDNVRAIYEAQKDLRA